MRVENHARILIWMVIVLAAATIAFAGLWGQEMARHVAYRDAMECADVLREMGPAFDKVYVTVTSHPLAAVMGHVSTDAELELLKKKFAESLPPDRRPHVRIMVYVDPATTEPSN